MVDLVLVSVTVISLALAAAMGVITWRVLRLERDRSAARVAALREAAGAGVSERTRDALDAPADRVDESTGAAVDVAAGHMFEAHGASDRLRAPGAALAVASVLVAVAATLAAGVWAGAARQPHQGSSPLELLALEHRLDGVRLSVRGLVKNPIDALPVDNVVAAVYLFDRQGQYVGVARAPLARSRLVPGGAAAFDVPVADGQAIGRYRVVFEIDARPVPHVDRRSGLAPARMPAVRVTLDAPTDGLSAR